MVRFQNAVKTAKIPKDLEQFLLTSNEMDCLFTLVDILEKGDENTKMDYLIRIDWLISMLPGQREIMEEIGKLINE